MLTQARLKEILHYDPKIGIFTWRINHGIRAKIGQKAGYKNMYGYWGIGIDQKNYKLHRLAWLYIFGEFPKNQIDHINLDKSDNRISNLREATPSENAMNRGIKSNNTSGFKGINWSRRHKSWCARISINNKRIQIGYFKDINVAHQAYLNAALIYHGEFAKIT